MTIAFWCILVAGLLPYAVFSLSAAKLDPKLPRNAARHLEGLPARAYAAHQNHFEAFPFFAAAVIVAHLVEGASSTVNWLALAFIAVRIGHSAAYLADIQPVRSACFTIGLILTLAIFVHPAFR